MVTFWHPVENTVQILQLNGVALVIAFRAL
jgi:hypothetical protein